MLIISVVYNVMTMDIMAYDNGHIIIYSVYQHGIHATSVSNISN